MPVLSWSWDPKKDPAAELIKEFRASLKTAANQMRLLFILGLECRVNCVVRDDGLPAIQDEIRRFCKIEEGESIEEATKKAIQLCKKKMKLNGRKKLQSLFPK